MHSQVWRVLIQNAKLTELIMSKHQLNRKEQTYM